MGEKGAAGAGPASGTLRDQAKVKTGNKDITKAVLASPLIIPWPNLPRNFQTAVMQELPRLVPDSIAAYHTDRARCQAERKKAARKQARASSKAAQGDDGTKQPEAGPSATMTTIRQAPTKPEVLDHLVLGINETIKSLEHAIDDLKVRLLMMADRLNGIHLKGGSNLLPTAPPHAPDEHVDGGKEAGSSSPSPQPNNADASPPAFIVIPLHSISPQTLVAPIQQYAATYNSLVWQWTQLAKIVKTRLKETEWAEVLGEEREEVRVVPLGRVEGEMAALVGLRRLACLTVRRSHLNIGLLEKILPKSILHPPRHALTLPYQTSNIAVHNGDPASGAPLPHVHYAPVTVKGITTSTPVDANSRKKKRLEEVRQKRVETKLKRKRERDGGGGGVNKKAKKATKKGAVTK